MELLGLLKNMEDRIRIIFRSFFLFFFNFLPNRYSSIINSYTFMTYHWKTKKTIKEKVPNKKMKIPIPRHIVFADIFYFLKLSSFRISNHLSRIRCLVCLLIPKYTISYEHCHWSDLIANIMLSTWKLSFQCWSPTSRSLRLFLMKIWV